jgi:hypothetical protein
LIRDGIMSLSESFTDRDRAQMFVALRNIVPRSASELSKLNNEQLYGLYVSKVVNKPLKPTHNGNVINITPLIKDEWWKARPKPKPTTESEK